MINELASNNYLLHEQLVCPGSEYVPVSQEVQEEPDWYVPAVHWVQTPASFPYPELQVPHSDPLEQEEQSLPQPKNVG